MKALEYKKRFGVDYAYLDEDENLLCPKCNKGLAIVTPETGATNCETCVNESTKWKLNNPQYDSGYPEFAPEQVKDDRKRHFNSMVQPYRGDTLSREYVEAYPDRAKKQYGDEVKKAKYVWKDVEGWSGRHKSA